MSITTLPYVCYYPLKWSYNLKLCSSFRLLGYCLGEQYNKTVDIYNLLGEDIEDVVELKNLVKIHREI